DLLVLEIVRHVCERGTEDERFHSSQAVLECVDELQQKATVGVHGSADVADQDDSRLPNLLRLAGQLNDRVTIFEIAPHSSAWVDEMALGRDPRTPALSRG